MAWPDMAFTRFLLIRPALIASCPPARLDTLNDSLRSVREKLDQAQGTNSEMAKSLNVRRG